MNLQSQSATATELLSASSLAPVLDHASLTTSGVGLGRASLLFIDGGVADYQQLVAGVATGTEVHVLDPVQDAVAQITAALLGREGISSLHIVSHGESGGLDFGSSRLNLSDLPGYAAQLQSWGLALTADADILLYGCDVAQGEVGKAFVNVLSQLTGADVAASDDLTGSSVLGGDWALEYQTGQIEAGLGFAPTAMGGYGKVLNATFAAVQQFTASSGSAVTPQKVVTDSSGNVYTTGYFIGTVDFDPGAATANLTSAGAQDIFVSKLDSSGNYVWAKRMGSTSSDFAYGISVDSSGNVYTTGYFIGTVDFDPGAATANLTSAGGSDIFVSKLDSSGNYVWAKGMGGTNFDVAYGISVDSSGNVYTTGFFNGTADFDPGAATANLTSAGGSYDIFVSKLDSSGNYVWAKGMGGTSFDVANGISVDSSGNVYTTGYFYDTADFDPGAGVVNLTPVGSPDGFLSKLSQNLAPTVTVAAAALSYTENDPATLIDPSATVSDTDSLSFDTGSLTVNYSAGGSVDDRLAIRNQGVGAGQIGVSGSTVTFGGVTIATFTGGTGTTPLVVTFNAASSPAAAQALLQNLTYSNVSDTPIAARTVQFILTDGDGGTSTAVTKTINVTAVNDAPTITAPATVTVTEDLATAITGISFADLDAGAASVTATFSVATGSLSAAGSGGVTVGPIASARTLTGSLTNLNAFIAANNLTYTTLANSNTALTLGVSINDNGNSPGAAQTTSTNVTINITPVNDAPSFTATNPATSLEDAGLQTLTSWASFNPGNAAESAQTATYTVSNLSNAALFTVAPTIAANGTLTYTAAPNANGSSTFDVIVTDNGGTANSGINTSTTQTFTITVSPVNDRPSFTASNPPASLEDGGVQTVPFATFNPGPADEATQTATYTVSNLSNPSLFTTAPTIAPNGSLSYTAAPNAFGTTTFDVVVQDNGGTANGGIDTSITQTFTLTLTPVNDRPSVTPSANHTVSAGAGAQTVASFVSFNPGAANEAGQTATYTIVNNSNPGLFSVQPTIAPDGTLIYTPVNTIGSVTTATLTVQVQDNGGTTNGGIDTSTTQTFTITVNPVNNRPSFAASNPAPSLEDGGVQTVPFATFNPGDPTESAQTATYTVSNLSNPSLFTVAPTIAPNGTLTYTAAPNAFGTATFDVVVRDNGGTANGGIDTSTTRTFTLTVNSVNDAPTVTPNANSVVTAGAGTQTIANFASFNPGAANEAGQTATYTIVTNSNPGLFAGQPTIAPDGTLTYTPIASLTSPQTATLTVQVQDSGGTANGGIDTSTTQTFTITVNPTIVVPPVTPPIVTPPVVTPPVTPAAAIPIFTVFQLRQTFTLNVTTQKLLAAQPSPALQQLFDEEFYLRQNPDVYTAWARGVFQSGFQHFLQYGQYEGRNPSSLFNEQFYLSQNVDVAIAVSRGNFRSGFQHFLSFGQFEGRNFCTAYNEQSYLAQNLDVAIAVSRGSFRSGFQHFLQFGFAEGRLSSLTLFNESYYLSQNPDVAAAVARGQFKNGLQHFEQAGQFEGRQPSTLFNERYYLSQNPDVAAAVAQGRFKSGFDHFLDFGRFEGRRGVG